MEKPEGLSDCEPDTRVDVSVVTDVPVSPSSVVIELCRVSPCLSDWSFVEPQSFPFSEQRAHCCAVTQEVMRYEDSPVKAPPLCRRRMTPPTPLQNSSSSFAAGQGHHEVTNQVWRVREKAPWRQSSASSCSVVSGGAVENYLENCADIEVDIDALALLLIEPLDEGVCPKVHPEVLDERRQQYFSSFFLYKRDKGSPRGE